MTVRAVCINKDGGNHNNPHETVTNYGYVSSSDGTTKVVSRTAMVDFIEKGGQAYVKDVPGNVAYCRVRTSVNGVKFLQTVSDNKYSNNILSLKECIL